MLALNYLTFHMCIFTWYIGISSQTEQTFHQFKKNIETSLQHYCISTLPTPKKKILKQVTNISNHHQNTCYSTGKMESNIHKALAQP